MLGPERLRNLWIQILNPDDGLTRQINQQAWNSSSAGWLRLWPVGPRSCQVMTRQLYWPNLTQLGTNRFDESEPMAGGGCPRKRSNLNLLNLPAS